MASIDVCIRFRPFLQSQPLQYANRNKIIMQDKYNQVKAQLTENKEKIFKFNHVVSASVSNEQLYERINISKLVQRVIEGYHSTIFAYGQTGSGKTYTIEGTEEDKGEGLTSKSIKNLFSMLKVKEGKAERGYKIYLSYIQIYNENIFDLLDADQRKPLKMRWNKLQQFTVEGMFEIQCRTAEQALTWWKKGQKNKIMGSHQMNSTSSRSHSLLTIRVQNYCLEDPSQQIESKLQMIDLAGSERHKLTKSTGAVFKEGIEINKSLFTLRQVITSLYEHNTNGKSTIMAPYRDSKLTSLLKHSIGGNSYCMMIACLNPSANQFQQSLQTLTYASMATFINNVPIKNIDPKIKQNQFLKQQNSQLRKQINKLQEHVKLLTKFMETNECKECRLKKNDSRLQGKQAKEPLGILHASIKIEKSNTGYITSEMQSFSMEVDKNLDSQSEKKTLKSAKEIIESIAMIRDLISSNSMLRQNMNSFREVIEKQEKQLFNLMKENQLLREKSEMPNINQIKSLNISTEAINEKIEKIKQHMEPERRRLYSLNNQPDFFHKKKTKPSHKLSYNELLSGFDSKQKIKYHRLKYNMQGLQ